MNRSEFIPKLNNILDDCGNDMPQGSKRRPFLVYSWKKYNRNNMNIVVVSRFKEIKDVLMEKEKWVAYLQLMFHR